MKDDMNLQKRVSVTKYQPTLRIKLSRVGRVHFTSERTIFFIEFAQALT